MSVACGRYPAGFALDDPDALVGAALSCPACLAGQTCVEVALTGEVVEVQCSCGLCASTWSLALKPRQLLRLSLDPPAGTHVHWDGQLPTSLLPPLPEDDLDA